MVGLVVYLVMFDLVLLFGGLYCWLWLLLEFVVWVYFVDFVWTYGSVLCICVLFSALLVGVGSWNLVSLLLLLVGFGFVCCVYCALRLFFVSICCLCCFAVGVRTLCVVLLCRG